MVACNAISRAVHPLGVLPPAGTRRAVALLQRESPGTGVPKPSEGRFGIFKAPLRRLRKHLPDVSHLLGYSPCLGFLPPRHVGKASAALGVAPSANRHFVSCEDSKAILDETSGTRGSQEAAVGSSDAVEVQGPRRLQGIPTDLFWVDRMQPTRCSGCGAPLQTDDENAIGFVPKSKLDEFSGGRIKALPRPRGEVVDAVPDGVEVIQVTLHALGIRLQELGVGAVLMTAGTTACFSVLTQMTSPKFRHYRNIDSAWESSAVTSSGMLPALSASSVITHLTRLMPKNSIILKIVDICDLELSVVPELFEACRQKGLKTLWIINRVDCLPRDTNLNEVKHWVRRMVRQIRNAHIDDCLLVSSATGFGFEALEKRIGDLLSAEAGDIEAGGIHTEADGRLMFVVGRVNAGKSTFVNRFLKFVGYKHFGTLFLKRAITNLLPHGPDLLAVVPSKRLQPVTYALTEGKSLLIGAMARIDLVEGRTALCTCFFSHKITLHICKTSRATDLLRRKACAFLYPPHLPEGFQRLQPLVRHRARGPRISARKRQLALEMRQETGREQMEREQRDGDAGTEREDDSGLRDIETRLPLVNEDGSKELQKLVAEWEGEQQKL
ncbi:uncharacterized protein LOC34622068 [Cyclospora cayetanensis]|uniref:Uncharacterized protein LOC34622068 n=1 Tax=Cyclospora cayetanensis TaxID=88456 RepID=A0A6P6RQ41_9EIME|nr:uncharacterized protein LOC34622068 [Cyclospora cayetanensis]